MIDCLMLVGLLFLLLLPLCLLFCSASGWVGLDGHGTGLVWLDLSSHTWLGSGLVVIIIVIVITCILTLSHHFLIPLFDTPTCWLARSCLSSIPGA